MDDHPLSYPQLRLDLDALEHNVALMAGWCTRRDVALAPHAKTTMSRPIVERQLAAGADGLTVATVDQVRTVHAWGARTILLANEVVATADLARLARLLLDDPTVRVTCFVDSDDGLARLADGLAPAAGRLGILVDVGTPGGRAGVRDPADARALAEAVARRPEVRLVGTAGYEGVVGNHRDDATLARIDAHCRRTAEVFAALADLYETDTPTFSMGGSAFPDRVVAARPTGTAARVVLRSGCYVTHDHGTYAAVSPVPGLRPALSVDALVLSAPEPGLAVLGAGRRDLPHDAGLPIVLAAGPPTDLVVTTLYDHHAVVRGDTVPRVGEVVRLGLSHPCSAFSRWEEYLVVRADRVVDRWSTSFVRRAVG